jgi:anti-sigma factor RsiW
MTREELEFRICEYLDGTLGEEERVALEGQLASDPEVQEILRRERELTVALRSGGAPLVSWEALAEQISGAIDQKLEERVKRASWAIRARSPWFMAAAASVGLSLGLAVFFAVNQRGGRSSMPRGLANTGVALMVEGPQEDRPAGPVVTEVSIGPGGSFAKAPALAPYADEMDARPTRVAIAAGTPVTTEEGPAPSPF